MAESDLIFSTHRHAATVEPCLRHRPLNRPSHFDAVVEDLREDAESFSPLGDGEHFATKFDDVVIPLVAVLNFHRGPSHISGKIPKRIVDPIDRMARRRRFANVSDKSLERFFPPLANGDAAPAVIGKAFMIGVSASCAHRTPNPVNARVDLAVRCKALATQAPTRPRCAAREAASSNDLDRATGAFARPVSCIARPLGSAENGQTTKVPAGEIVDWHKKIVANPRRTNNCNLAAMEEVNG